MVIDFHAHIYPEKIAQKVTESIGDFYNLKVRGEGTARELLANEKTDRFVVHSVAQTPPQVAAVNDFISGAVKENPKFIGFGSLHPDMENPEEEAERLISLGLKGVKLHPDFQNFNADDKKADKIYDILSGRLPVLIHCGDYRFERSHPRRVKNVIKKFPKLVVIGAHYGGWSQFDIALENLLEENCFLDVSSSIPFLGNKRAKELIGIYGAQRMLFGSDYPMWSPDSELERFLSLGLSSSDNDLILYKNALRIVE
ncbi:amidohydrolase [Clostridia bacterium]|nr:amidohydrolase [Clostridia bacterium]